MSYFQFEVEGIAHEWDTDQSEIRFMGSPVMIIWIPPLADLMRGMAELMGPAFRLAMQHGGRKSGEASFRFFEQAASGVLTLPLVGELDDERARQVTETLLWRIVQTQASIVIVDITGVPTVDTRVANHLIKAVRAAELLGTQCLLVGISPQIAQTLIDQNIPLYGITTCATLQQGLEQALSLLNLKVEPAGPNR
jgi:anti-anti-sigma regulatory factor